MERRESWWSGTRIVWGIALGTVAVHLATGWRYGFDRDELMALEDARHLAWGYVTYPPMTAFFGRVALELFGTSLVGFRFFAAVAQALALVLTGMMARSLENGKWKIENGSEGVRAGVNRGRLLGKPGEWAQVVAALAGVPFCLGGGALMQYISFDYVCWVVVAYGMVRVVGVEDCKEDENGKWKIENGEEGSGGGIQEQGILRTWGAAVLRPYAESGNGPWWLVVGWGFGLGMRPKYTMGFLVVGVAAGVLLTRARRWLRSGWLWLGALVALGIWLPNLLWQWRRGFPSLEFLKFIHERDVGTGVTDWFLLGQMEMTLLALPLAVAGLWFYFFGVERGGKSGLADSPGARCVVPLRGLADRHGYRAIGWMYLVPLILFLVMRGRDYYLAPGYPMLYAAGAVFVEKKWRVASDEWRVEEKDNAEAQRARRFAEGGRSLADRVGDGAYLADRLPSQLRASRRRSLQGSRRWWLRRVVWVALVVDILAAGAVALPIVPVNSGWWRFAARVDSVFPEEIGWGEFVETVAGVRDRLPVEERARAGILAGNYGELGALNLYGEKYGLPRAISGVNSSWERGYGSPAPETVIVTGYSREFLERHFASCEVGARVWNRFGVANEETIEDPEIFVCRGLRESWGEFWKGMRKFA